MAMPLNKLTKVLVMPETLFGFTDYYKAELNINIQYIWEETRNPDRFIQLFSTTYAHELLHLMIEEILDELMEYGSEKSIRAMLGEKWTKQIAKYYTSKIIKGKIRGYQNGKKKN